MGTVRQTPTAGSTVQVPEEVGNVARVGHVGYWVTEVMDFPTLRLDRAGSVVLPAELVERYETARAEWLDAQNAVRQHLDREPEPDPWGVRPLHVGPDPTGGAV
jgi:hypothetical protein